MSPVCSSEKSFYEYSKRFYIASHEIASFLLDSGEADISHLDTWFFSLAFLYRHSIELLLKAIAFQHIQDKIAKKKFVKDTFHNLEILLVEIIKIRETNRSVDELAWLKSYFKDISIIDKNSDSFRYPFHIKKERDVFGNYQYSMQRIFEEQTHIDLVRFTSKFEAAYEILLLWYENIIGPANKWVSLKPIFIEQGGAYYTQSVVGFGYRRQDFYPYLNAYFESACLLRQKMTDLKADNKNEYLQELYFLPMCYLYRNAVELALKSAWFEEVRESFQYRCKILYINKHKIDAMWKILRNWIVDFYKEDSDVEDYFDKIEKCCDELKRFDPDASRFRYPCNKSMDPYCSHTLKIDYMNIAEFMESLITAIDCIGYELSARNDYINDMEAEYISDIL